MLGHICSGAAKAALGIYRDAGVIAMSPSATNPELTQSGKYPNFYRTIAPDDAQARIEVDFALDTLKVGKIAVLHDKGDYGRGLAEFAKKFIEASGGRGQVVLFEGITPGRGRLFGGGPEGPAVRRRGGDLRRLPPRGLQARRRMRKKQIDTAVHLRRRRQGRHLHQGRRRVRRGRLRLRAARHLDQPARAQGRGSPPRGLRRRPGGFLPQRLGGDAGPAQRHRQGRQHRFGRGREGAPHRVRRDAPREDPLRRARGRRGRRLRDLPGQEGSSRSR